MSKFLKPDKTDKINGLTIKRKIIPLKAKRKNGNYFRDQRKLSPKYVTIHNTGTINQAKGTTMAEQYSRATYPNDNMGTVRPHYYVDDVEAWQLIEHDRVAWHAGEQGNTQSIGIEIIGAKGEDNGARLAATVLLELGLTTAALRTHNHWMGLPDRIVSGARKNCPYYILPHWDKFVAKAAKYVKEFSGKPEPKPEPGADTYTVVKGDSPWTIAAKLLGDGRRYKEIEQLNGLSGDYDIYEGQVLKMPTGSAPAPAPKLATYQVTARAGLNYRASPSASGRKLGAFNFGQKVEIEKQQSGWGYVPEVKGWISMQYVKKV